jgi:hypothetical protein
MPVGRLLRLVFLAIALAGAPLVQPSQATPITFDFDTLAPATMAQGTAFAVGAGFTVVVGGLADTSYLVIDTGATPPDPGNAVPGDLASAHCLANLCASNATPAIYAFSSAAFTLTAPADTTFDLSGFDAAIASNGLSRATRFSVTGLRSGAETVSATVLLLPAGFFPDLGGTAISAAPSDTAATAAEWFQTIELTGFTGIDELRFASVGEVASDPQDLLDNGFLPEFAIDALRIITIPADAPTEVVEPATPGLLLAALGCLFVLRRRPVRSFGIRPAHAPG